MTHHDPGYGPPDLAREVHDARRDALRRGRGAGARPPQYGEDEPSRREANEDEDTR